LFLTASDMPVLASGNWAAAVTIVAMSAPPLWPPSATVAAVVPAMPFEQSLQCGFRLKDANGHTFDGCPTTHHQKLVLLLLLPAAAAASAPTATAAAAADAARKCAQRPLKPVVHLKTAESAPTAASERETAAARAALASHVAAAAVVWSLIGHIS